MWPNREAARKSISCTSIMSYSMGNNEELMHLPSHYEPESSVSAMRRFTRRQVAYWKRTPKWVVVLPTLLYMFFVYWTWRPQMYLLHQDTFPSRLMPLRLWQHQAMYPEAYRGGRSCGVIPSGHDITRRPKSSVPSKLFWQRVPLNGGTAFAYAAYWDTRGKPSGKGVIRILMYSLVAPLPTLYCQLWYYGSAVPLVISAQHLYAWPNTDRPIHGASEPYIITCDPSKATLANGSTTFTFGEISRSTLAAVSLVKRPCEKAVNVLNIQNAPIADRILNELNEDHRYRNSRLISSPNDSVAVCVKMSSIQDDMSTRLVEWLQMIKRFGVSKVYIYMFSKTHENILKVVSDYEYLGFLDVTPIILPPMPASHTSHPPSIQRDLALKTQLMLNNDCLYRVLDKHQWITMLDIHQIIVPMTDLTWTKLAKRQEYFDGITFDSYFFPPLEQPKRKAWLVNHDQRLFGPPGSVMLKNVWRTRYPTDKETHSRSLFNVQTVLACHNHQPLWCKSDGNDDMYTDIDDSKENIRPCKVIKVAKDIGRLYNYRSCKYSQEDICDENNLIKDDILVKRYGADVGFEIVSNLQLAGVLKSKSTSTTPSENL